MLVFLGILLTWTLLVFGGVLRHSLFALVMVWLTGSACLVIVRTIRYRRLDLLLISLPACGAICLVFAGPHLTVWVLAFLWSWLAARDNPTGVIRFFHFLLFIGILEAMMGLAQYFFAPGWIFGYQNRGALASGTLINRNHFAGLLEMIIPVSLGLAFIAARRHGEIARPYIYVLSGAFIALALLFSLSRMGILSFLGTVLFISIILQLRTAQRRMAVGLGLGLMGLVGVGAVWIGVDAIVERYDVLLEQDAALREGRMLVFRDTLRMIGASPGGVGTGMYRDVFRQYQTVRPDLLFDHAHNDYLETAAEWGIAAAVLLWATLFAILTRSVRHFFAVGSPEQGGILLACMGAITTILLHSLADFNLQIPSNAMLFFTFAGVSLGISPSVQKRL